MISILSTILSTMISILSTNGDQHQISPHHMSIL